MITAKLFKNGRSQAVRLPKEFRMPGKEVRVYPNISRVFSGAYVANVKRSCIRILQVQTFAADVPLKTRPQGKPPFENSLVHSVNFESPRDDT